jgi:hypothetical protein
MVSGSDSASGVAPWEQNSELIRQAIRWRVPFTHNFNSHKGAVHMDAFLVRLQALLATAEAAADEVDAQSEAYSYVADEAFLACERDLVDIFGE